MSVTDRSPTPAKRCSVCAHELRTEQIIALPEIEDALDRIGVDPEQVLALISGDPLSPYPVLRELVSGPNLDADRMDYLLRDAYFTGVANGRYDTDQLVASLRVIDRFGTPVPRRRRARDRRARVVRPRALHDVLDGLLPPHDSPVRAHPPRRAPRTLARPTRARSDRRVLAVGRFPRPRSVPLRDRRAVARDPRSARRSTASSPSSTQRTTSARLKRANAHYAMPTATRCGRTRQEQLMHRLPLVLDGRAQTVFVRTRFETIDAREASDLIARITGTAYWRKLFVGARASGRREGASDLPCSHGGPKLTVVRNAGTVAR